MLGCVQELPACTLAGARYYGSRAIGSHNPRTLWIGTSVPVQGVSYFKNGGEDDAKPIY